MKKFLARALYGIFTLLLVGVAALFFAPLLPIKGNIEIKIVKSGSMEPAVKTGGIVVIKPSATYNVGDIITFGEDSPTTHPTTHRVVSIDQVQDDTLYQMKGDANEEPDPTPVKRSDVIGKVIFTVPKAGYLLDFARHPIGFILLIAFPAALVILNEIIDIGKEIRKVIRRRRKNRLVNIANESPHAKGMIYHTSKKDVKTILKRCYRMDDVLRPVYSVHNEKKKGNAPFMASIMVIFATSVVFAHSGDTVSYFADAENSLGNMMSAISFEISASALPEESYVGESDSPTIVSTVTLNPLGLPHDYKITVEETGGSSAFCQALMMSSTSTPPFIFNGPILNFNSATTTFSGDWQFEVSLSPEAEGVDAGDICVIDLVYSADTWLADEVSYGGYSDVERVTLTFEADEQVQALEVNTLGAFLPPETEITEEPPQEETAPPEETDEPAVGEESLPEETVMDAEEEPVTEEEPITVQGETEELPGEVIPEALPEGAPEEPVVETSSTESVEE